MIPDPDESIDTIVAEFNDHQVFDVVDVPRFDLLVIVVDDHLQHLSPSHPLLAVLFLGHPALLILDILDDSSNLP